MKDRRSLFRNIRMSKIITTIILFCCVYFSSNSYGDQESLDLNRTLKLEAVLDSLKKGDAAALSAILPELKKDEASKLILQISKSWGDLAKISTAQENLPEEFDKGRMEIVGNWGEGATSSGKWLELKSKEAPNRWLRIGLLFQKGSSDAKQFLAVEIQSAEKGGAEKPATGS